MDKVPNTLVHLELSSHKIKQRSTPATSARLALFNPADGFKVTNL